MTEEEVLLDQVQDIDGFPDGVEGQRLAEGVHGNRECWSQLSQYQDALGIDFPWARKATFMRVLLAKMRPMAVA